MALIPMFLKELEREAQTTRKMLERIPNDKYDWQPHEKSMTIRRLATHVAELPSWITMAVKTEGLDFQNNPYDPVVINNTSELLNYFEEELAKGKNSLNEASEDKLSENWTLSSGNEVLYTAEKSEVIRMALNQVVHHRAQMGVYLRLLNVPIPGSYGPSADEH